MPSYRCFRSWSHEDVHVSYPDGLSSDRWNYAEGRAFMQAVVEYLLPESREFRITYEDTPRRGPFDRRRRFTITLPRGHVTLEPLVTSYEAAFGMLSVFASDALATASDPERAALLAEAVGD